MYTEIASIVLKRYWARFDTPGYAVLVEKVGLFWKKPYFFSDGQVLVV
jgi:hypothetical protein